MGTTHLIAQLLTLLALIRMFNVGVFAAIIELESIRASLIVENQFRNMSQVRELLSESLLEKEKSTSEKIKLTLDIK